MMLANFADFFSLDCELSTHKYLRLRFLPQQSKSKSEVQLSDIRETAKKTKKKIELVSNSSSSSNISLHINHSIYGSIDFTSFLGDLRKKERRNSKKSRKHFTNEIQKFKKGSIYFKNEKLHIFQFEKRLRDSQ